MAKPFKKALTISTCLLVAVALTIGAVAWFAGYKNIGNMGFQTGSNANLPEMKMWMYYSATDGATGVEQDTEGWEEQSIGGDPSGKNEYLTIPAVTASGTGYELKSLHFGKVDNLVTLKNDNKVLLRFYFDESMLNNPDGLVHYVAFTLAYNTEGYSYDETEVSVLDSIHLLKEVTGGAEEVDLKENRGDENNPSYVLEYREDEPRAMQFLQIRYAVSNQAYEPGANGFDGISGLTFHDAVPINCGSCGALKTGSDAEYICDKCHNNTCGQARLDDTDLSILGDQNADGTYNIGDGFYVYIELAPLLDAFGMQENILDYFVPAYMFFDVKLDVEIG